MAVEKFCKTAVLSLLTGITFFGAVRSISVPCVTFDPNLELAEATEDLTFALTLIGVVALASVPVTFPVCQHEQNTRELKDWFSNRHWALKGPIIGMPSSLLLFGFLQALQAIVRNVKEHAELSEMGNFVELMVTLGFCAIGLSVFAALLFRRQEQQANADVTIPLQQQNRDSNGYNYGSL